MCDMTNRQDSNQPLCLRAVDSVRYSLTAVIEVRTELTDAQSTLRPTLQSTFIVSW